MTATRASTRAGGKKEAAPAPAGLVICGGWWIGVVRCGEVKCGVVW